LNQLVNYWIKQALKLLKYGQIQRNISP